MTSADYKEDPTLAVISFCVSSCKQFITRAKWMFRIIADVPNVYDQREQQLQRLLFGHPNCGPVNTPTITFQNLII